MKLEEYISMRKKEDGLNEYDLENRSANTRICVNYVFEYFNNYLETKPADEKIIMHDQKIEKYRNIIIKYDSEIRDWLLSIYSSHGIYLHMHLLNLIKDNYFLLYDSDAEFRALSYEIYPKIKSKFKFLEGQSEMIFQFIKDTHRLKSKLDTSYLDFYISDNINEWIHDTYKKHGVNIYNFCSEWVERFSDNPDIWPKGHKKKSKYYDEYNNRTSGRRISNSMLWDYDYKQKNNLFGIDILYRNIPKKSFITGKKQEIEAVMMYCWLHDIDGEDDYWEKYAKEIL